MKRSLLSEGHDERLVDNYVAIAFGDLKTDAPAPEDDDA
jgi:hypothetical protein